VPLLPATLRTPVTPDMPPAARRKAGVPPSADVVPPMGDALEVRNEPAELRHDAFINSADVLTKDTGSRVVSADDTVQSAADCDPATGCVADGAAIGTRSVRDASVRIGRLEESGPGLWICHETGERYRDTPDNVVLEET
jgi:hypothetical protein